MPSALGKETIHHAEQYIASTNECLARQINREARQNPDSLYAGKFVGIVDGQVVVVADSLRAAMQRLHEIEPDLAKCFCLDASADYEQVDEIWRLF